MPSIVAARISRSTLRPAISWVQPWSTSPSTASAGASTRGAVARRPRVRRNRPGGRSRASVDEGGYAFLAGAALVALIGLFGVALGFGLRTLQRVRADSGYAAGLTIMRTPVWPSRVGYPLEMSFPTRMIATTVRARPSRPSPCTRPPHRCLAGGRTRPRQLGRRPLGPPAQKSDTESGEQRASKPANRPLQVVKACTKVRADRSVDGLNLRSERIVARFHESASPGCRDRPSRSLDRRVRPGRPAARRSMWLSQTALDRD